MYSLVRLSVPLPGCFNLPTDRFDLRTSLKLAVFLEFIRIYLTFHNVVNTLIDNSHLLSSNVNGSSHEVR